VSHEVPARTRRAYTRLEKQASRCSLETPEVHKPHARHAGGLPRWLELLIAITALVTSISSIAIAVHHGHIMEMLVQANSLPFMQGGFSNVTPEGKEVLSLDLLNRGVGPAHEESLRVKVGNRYVRSGKELVAASLGAEEAARAQPSFHVMFNRVRTRFIPGGQMQFVFRLPKTEENAQLWDLLSKAQERWDVEFCYCSVFEECWEVRGKWEEPVHVKRCERDESREFLP
jgi:hypothetical protein